MSFLNKEKSYQDAFNDLYIQLSVFKDIIDLRNHKGWVRLANAFIKTIAQIEDQKDALEVDPIKNSQQIIFLKATRDSMITLLQIVEKSEGGYRAIMDKIDKQMETITEAAGRGIPIE